MGMEWGNGWEDLERDERHWGVEFPGMRSRIPRKGERDRRTWDGKDPGDLTAEIDVIQRESHQEWWLGMREGSGRECEVAFLGMRSGIPGNSMGECEEGWMGSWYGVVLAQGWNSQEWGVGFIGMGFLGMEGEGWEPMEKDRREYGVAFLGMGIGIPGNGRRGMGGHGKG